ncbi:hypothetical protein C8R48DRAFT_779529 [Suillus tomentosus]|nr:hypothetical protein C8R48DRAFT_779529 [Suillus tomentosus]
MRIIFFRGGLSEGEYALTGQEEIDDITGAIDDIWQEKGVKGAKPELTFIVNTQKSRNRARDQSVSPISPGCCATHYQTPQKLRVSSEHLSPMLMPSPLRRRPSFPADAQHKADGLAQEQDHDDSNIFL